MKKYVEAAKKADFKAIGQRFGIDQVTARIIRNRDIITPEEVDEFLNATKEDFGDPTLMADMLIAVDIIREALELGTGIRIIGDYDIDGVCAAYILLDALKSVGADVSADIPHRIYDGYGINEEIVERAHSDGIGLIITCDNGIAAHPAISLAREYGMDVIVTDHHEVPYILDEAGYKRYNLVDADAIVNPKREDCAYPFKGHCGAVVALWLIRALFSELISEDSGFEGKLNYEKYLEMAAIATVGDVMELKGENRTIVKEGLKQLNSTKNIGLRALIARKELSGKEIKAYHIGFVLGPCLNASGRLETAKIALKLLTAEDSAEAERIADRLVTLNEERKDMTSKGTERAVEMIENSDLKNDRVLVLYLKNVHESVAGIIAGRIRERYSKPVFVLTDGEDCVKGSGRSIAAYSMFEEMSRMSELFIKFGGHPMAAGLSIKSENVDEFRRRLNEMTTLKEEDFIEKVYIDAKMPFAYANIKLAEELSVLEPFGNKNPKPVFALQNVRIKSIKVVGTKNNAMSMVLEDEFGCSVKAILFEDVDGFRKKLDKKLGAGSFERLLSGREFKNRVSVVYYPDIDDYGGIKQLRIRLSDVL